MAALLIGTPVDRLIPLDVRLAFGLGQMAEGIKGFSFSLFALFYYNSVLDWPFYKMHEEFIKHPDYWVRTLGPFGFWL